MPTDTELGSRAERTKKKVNKGMSNYAISFRNLKKGGSSKEDLRKSGAIPRNAKPADAGFSSSYNPDKGKAGFVKPKRLLQDVTETTLGRPTLTTGKERPSAFQSPPDKDPRGEKFSDVASIMKARKSADKRYDENNNRAYTRGVNMARRGDFTGMDENQKKWFLQEAKKNTYSDSFKKLKRK